MNIIAVVLLGVIAISEILRLVLTHRTQGRRSYFKQKLDQVTKMIWDLEFKTYKTQEIREQVREEYDRMKSRIATLTEQIGAWPKGKEEGEKKRLEDQKVLAERDAGRFEAQMKQLDLEVHGSKRTQEYPDGVTGIKDSIDSLLELKAMLRDWIKRNG